MHTEQPAETFFQCAEQETGRRLDVVLASRYPDISRARFQQLIAERQVTVNGQPVRQRHLLAGGDTVVFAIQEPAPVSHPAPQNIPLSVLYEDHDLIVLDKPPGLVVHPAPGHHDGTLVNALLHHCGDLAGIGGEKRPGIVHRLDKDTSGVIVAAKHEKSFLALGMQFRQRSVHKEYLAIVSKTPLVLAGMIDGALGRHPRDRLRFAVTRRGGRAALTFYRVIEKMANASLLELKISTGRTHQIRVHLAWLGHPVLGDTLYGGSSRLPDGSPVPRQMLHARRLEFLHPDDGRTISVEAPLPADMQAILSRLRNSPSSSRS